MGQRATASRSSLILSDCTSWLHPAAVWDEVGSKHATFGTLVHTAIHKEWEDMQLETGTILTTPEEDSVYESYVVPAIGLLEKLLAETDPGAQVFAENALCFNCETGQVTQIPGGREVYPAGNKWFCGTADILIVYSDSVTILDWKTGDPFKAADQLATLAYMACKRFSKTKARMISVKVEDGRSWFAQDVRDISDMVLLHHFHNVVDTLYSAPGQAKVGPWCTELYCPHRLACSSLAATYNVDPPPTPTESNVHQLIPAIKLLGEKRDKMKESLEDFVRGKGGVQLPDGKWYTETFQNRSYLDTAQLEELAKQYGASETEIASCQKSRRSPAGFRSQRAKS